MHDSMVEAEADGAAWSEAGAGPPEPRDQRYEADLLGNIQQAMAGLQGFDIMALELIQNADDAGAAEMRFDVRRDGLHVWNSGSFSSCGLADTTCPMLEHKGRLCNFHAISKMGSRSKIGLSSQIGRFGIGFISVYQVTDRRHADDPNGGETVMVSGAVGGRRRSRPSKDAARLYFDGASTPNPGAVETNVHFAGRDRKRRSPAGTAPQAVWLAVFRALYVARREGHRRIVLVGDSKMVFWHAGKDASRHSEPIRRVIDRCEAQFGRHFDEVTVELVDARRNVAREAMGRARGKAAARPAMWHAWY